MTYIQIFNLVKAAGDRLARQESLPLKEIILTSKKELGAQGKCSHNGVIHITVHRSQEAMESVRIIRTAQTICHELSHLKEMNHGPEFWRYQEYLCLEMSKILGMKIQPERYVV